MVFVARDEVFSRELAVTSALVLSLHFKGEFQGRMTRTGWLARPAERARRRLVREPERCGRCMYGGRRGTEVRDLDDAEVVAAVTAGDRDAFRLLVERYGALAQRTAVLLGAGYDADDVVQ